MHFDILHLCRLRSEGGELIRTRLQSAALICALSVFANGCAGIPTTPYPVDWPLLAPETNCRDVAGRYINRADRTTIYKSLKLGQFQETLMSKLFMTGTSGTTSREVESQGSLGVELDPIRQLIFTVGEANVGTLRSEGVWQCQSNGRILIRWPEKPTDSEGWIASSRSLDIELYVAADRSLVVKLTIRDLATSLLATRHRSESTEWLLFRRS